MIFHNKYTKDFKISKREKNIMTGLCLLYGLNILTCLLYALFYV